MITYSADGRYYWDGYNWRLVPQQPPPVQFTVRPINHILHLLLTIFTGGLWGFVWLYLLATSTRAQYTVQR